MAWRRRPALTSPRVLLLAALAAACAAVAAPAAATDIAALQSRVDEARGEAGALAADLEAKQAEMVAAQRQAAAAAAREAELSAMLAAGEQRSARLGAEVARAERELDRQRARLRRSLAVLAERLVAIYKSEMPDATALVLGSDGFDDLATRAEYLAMIEDSDSRLAGRVRDVRDAVRFQLGVVERVKARQDAYNARLALARDQIGAVRAEAEAQAAELAAIRASRAATLAELRSNISGWVGEIQQAQQVRRAGGGDGRQVARRPLLDPRLDRDVRVGRQLRRGQPVEWRRRRLPDPALDLGYVRRRRGPAPGHQAGAGQDRGPDLVRLGRRGVGLRRLGLRCL